MGSTQSLPRARTDNLVVHTLPDEVLVYDLKRHKAHCLNQTAASVWERCDGRTTVAEMASQLGRDLNTPVHEDVVWLALERLENVHLLQEHTPTFMGESGMSRRKMVRQLGLSAAIAIPAIISIVAPEAAQAATLLPNGTPCTASSQCIDGCCRLVGGVQLCKPGVGDCL